jgi:predicted metal-dependent hydrolase
MEVQVRKSRKAKRIFIKITTKQTVELVVPFRQSEDIALNFLKSKADWVSKKLKSISKSVANDSSLPIWGTERKLIHVDYKIPTLFKLEDDCILVSNHLQKSDIPIMLNAYLRNLLKYDLVIYCDNFAKAIGAEYNKIKIKDTKTQWGSCNIMGDLSFSAKLIHAPKFVIEYLAAHEVSHLLERNHSSRFWKLVNSICPDYKNARKYLRIHGHQLHLINLGKLPLLNKKQHLSTDR